MNKVFYPLNHPIQSLKSHLKQLSKEFPSTPKIIIKSQNSQNLQKTQNPQNISKSRRFENLKNFQKFQKLQKTKKSNEISKVKSFKNLTQLQSEEEVKVGSFNQFENSPNFEKFEGDSQVDYLAHPQHTSSKYNRLREGSDMDEKTSLRNSPSTSSRRNKSPSKVNSKSPKKVNISWKILKIIVVQYICRQNKKIEYSGFLYFYKEYDRKGNLKF